MTNNDTITCYVPNNKSFMNDANPWKKPPPYSGFQSRILSRQEDDYGNGSITACYHARSSLFQQLCLPASGIA